jgi:hypothetical protein
LVTVEIFNNWLIADKDKTGNKNKTDTKKDKKEIEKDM